MPPGPEEAGPNTGAPNPNVPSAQQPPEPMPPNPTGEYPRSAGYYQVQPPQFVTETGRPAKSDGRMIGIILAWVGGSLVLGVGLVALLIIAIAGICGNGF